MTSEEREQEVVRRNAERKQQRESATRALNLGDVNEGLEKIAQQGGALGRRLEREIRRFEQTGRVSNWLTGETIKADAAQNAAQQGTFRQQAMGPLSTVGQPIAVDFIPPSVFGDTQITEAAASADCIGLALYTKTVGENTQVWIGAGTIAGDLPSGFDPTEGKFIASSGSGLVFAEIGINNSGEITSRSVQSGGYTSDSKRYLLGNYVYNQGTPTVTNFGCGTIDASICRNWYASEEPFYSVLLTRCGCASQQ